MRKQYDFKHLYYSEPYISYHIIAIARTSNAFKIDAITDFIGRKVAAWQLAKGGLGDEFRHATDQRVGTISNTRVRLIRIVPFGLGKVTSIIIDRSIFRWNQRQLASEIDTTNTITIYPLFDDSTEYTVSFSNLQTRDRFNKKLKDLKDGGGHQRILNRYIDDMPG